MSGNLRSTGGPLGAVLIVDSPQRSPRRALIALLSALLLVGACVAASLSLRAVDDSLLAIAKMVALQYRLQDIEQSLCDGAAAAQDYARTQNAAVLPAYDTARARLDAQLEQFEDLAPTLGVPAEQSAALGALARAIEGRNSQVIVEPHGAGEGSAQALPGRGRADVVRGAALRAVAASLQTEARRQIVLREHAVQRSRTMFLWALCLNGAVAALLLLFVVRQALRR